MRFALVFLLGSIACANPNDIIGVSAGFDFSCALKSNKARCFGRNTYGESVLIEGFQNAKRIASGIRTVCVIDDDGLWCWGDNTYGQTNVPLLEDVVDVAPSAYHTCALAKGGVTCWSTSHPRYTTIPPMKNVRQIAAGYAFTCALHDDGISCWGLTDGKPPSGKFQGYQLIAGHNNACVYNSQDIKCWGSLDGGEAWVPKGLKNIAEVDGTQDEICSIADGALACWRKSVRTQHKKISKPRLISAGWEHMCAVDEQGFKCWRSDGDENPGDKRLEVPLDF